MWLTEKVRSSDWPFRVRTMVTSHFWVFSLKAVRLGSRVDSVQTLTSSTSTYDSKKLASLPAGVKIGQLAGKG